jgi:hypothetical protein
MSDEMDWTAIQFDEVVEMDGSMPNYSIVESSFTARLSMNPVNESIWMDLSRRIKGSSKRHLGYREYDHFLELRPQK